jgi:phosphatidate phosphatase APP1
MVHFQEDLASVGKSPFFQILLSQHSSDLRRPVNLMLVFVVSLTMLVACPGQADGDDDPALVQIYNGLGTTKGARIWGRVIEDEGDKPSKRKERWYRKLKRNIKALESDEIPHARLELKVLGRKLRVKADEEGLFSARVKGPLPVGSHPVKAALKEKRRYRVTAGRLLIWPARGARVAVISDIDDTVLQTGVGDKLRMARRVLSTNAHDLKTYEHAPALYRVWARRGHPIVFVSGSPVNLYPKLIRFLALQRFPAAPLLLKDFGGKHALTEQVAYKLDQIERVLKLLPGYKLLLVGDSGESDPEIYAKVAQKHRDRVLAIMIHRLKGKQRAGRERLEKEQLYFKSYLELARALEKQKLLTGDELKKIEGGK